MFKKLFFVLIGIMFITSCSFFKFKKASEGDVYCDKAPKTSRICSVVKSLNWNAEDLTNKIMKANLVAVASGQITVDEILETTEEIRTKLNEIPSGTITYDQMIDYLKYASTEVRKGILISIIIFGDEIDAFAIPEIVDPHDLHLINGLLNNIDDVANSDGRMIEALK